jgi:hypothetical protein
MLLLHGRHRPEHDPMSNLDAIALALFFAILLISAARGL